MPEPDFEQLARDVMSEAAGYMAAPEGTLGLAFGSIHRALVSVWNARGAADRTALADLLIVQPSNICQPVQYALRKLDR